MPDKIIKKILLTLASVFLIWQSIKLFTGIHHFNEDSWGRLLLMAGIINLYITGIFAFAGFAFPTQKLLPASYYTISNSRKLKTIFKKMKVEWFRKFLLATFWKNAEQQKKYFNGKKEGIENLENQSMKSEFGHLFPFMLISLIALYLLTLGQIWLAFFTLIVNLFFNLYPIILQRHHRMRIQIIKRRLGSRK